MRVPMLYYPLAGIVILGLAAVAWRTMAPVAVGLLLYTPIHLLQYAILRLAAAAACDAQRPQQRGRTSGSL